MSEHRLLQRQIRKHLGPDAELTPALASLLKSVSETYTQYDNDRRFVEHAMETSSTELFAANPQLSTQNEKNTEVLNRLRLLANHLAPHTSGSNPALHSDATDVLVLSDIINDLIHRRETVESQLRVALDEAQAANSAKSDFLATMSHEIRTPMNAIIGFTDLLLDSPLSPPQQRFAETLRRSGHDLLTVINDILDFSKIEAGRIELEPVPCASEEVAQEVIDLISPRSRAKGLDLLCRPAAHGPHRALADIVRLRQILINLVGNSVKFTERGHIHIDIAPAASVAGPWAESAPAATVQRELLFCITDTGIGISEEKQAQLFQKFMQADSSTTRKYGGTGLGLAISKRLVELMSGRIGVISNPGQGSTFWFTLPLAQPRVEPINPLSFHHSHSNHHGLRVLVADDNEINLALASELLKRLGCEVDLAMNGQEAVDATQRKTYDLVFMDCRMPIMDGYDATGEIRQCEKSTGRHLAIIALTANAIEGDRERCLAAGMDDYLSKPVRKAALSQMLTRWCRPAAIAP